MFGILGKQFPPIKKNKPDLETLHQMPKNNRVAKNKKPDPFRLTLSFRVESITQRMVAGVAVYDTIILDYVTGSTLVLRGNYWPVGTKVDFVIAKYWSLGQDAPCKNPRVSVTAERGE